MGSSPSKAAQAVSKVAPTTAPKAARKYPTRSPPPPSTTPRPAASRIPAKPVRAAPIAPPTHTKRNAPPPPQDPSLLNQALNDRLRELGPIIPNPTYSNSSTVNTTRPSAPNPNADPTTTVQSFQPSPTNPAQTIYPSRSANPAVSLLTARYRLAEEAEKEFAETGRSTHAGRSFIDVVTLRQMLVLREQGLTEAEIEKKLQLKGGVMAKLEKRGVVGVAR